MGLRTTYGFRPACRSRNWIRSADAAADARRRRPRAQRPLRAREPARLTTGRLEPTSALYRPCGRMVPEDIRLDANMHNERLRDSHRALFSGSASGADAPAPASRRRAGLCRCPVRGGHLEAAAVARRPVLGSPPHFRSPRTSSHRRSDSVACATCAKDSANFDHRGPIRPVIERMLSIAVRGNSANFGPGSTKIRQTVTVVDHDQPLPGITLIGPKPGKTCANSDTWARHRQNSIKHGKESTNPARIRPRPFFARQ